jgi:hypothetical protein
LSHPGHLSERGHTTPFFGLAHRTKRLMMGEAAESIAPA